MPDPDDKRHLVSGFHSRGVLPHLKREGGTYFVTFRQAGTLPKEVLRRFKQEREAIIQQAMAGKRPLTWHEQEELFRWDSSRVDKYLDAGHGPCYLRDPEVAELVAGAIRFFEGQRYELRAWVGDAQPRSCRRLADARPHVERHFAQLEIVHLARHQQTDADEGRSTLAK